MLKGIHERECNFYTTFRNVEGLKIPRVIDLKLLTDEDKVS